MDRPGVGVGQGAELQLYLARFGRHLRLRDSWQLAQRSLWIACLVVVCIQFVGRIWPVDHLWRWTLAPLVAWMLVVVGLSLLRPLSPMRVARRVDAELGLKERLATALVLDDWMAAQLKDVDQQARQSAGPPAFQPALAGLQHHDAVTIARTIQPRRTLPLRWLRRPLLLAAFFVALVVALAVLPNPMDAVLAERAAVAQAAEEQAEQVEKLREEIEEAVELTPQEREGLLRQLAELAEQLRANPGDREEALADLSRVEEALRQMLDPNATARQVALEALTAQLQALVGSEGDTKADLSDAAEALDKLAEELAGMDAAEREALAQSVAQMAARAAQAGDSTLAQALATLAQAMQIGDSDAVSPAAQAAADALAQVEGELADQAALRQALSELQESRQAVARAGQGQGQGQAAAQGLGQGQGQGQGQAAGQGPGQGQGQGRQPGGSGGTKADTLPPSSGTGRAGRPQGEGPPGATGELDQQVYVPWERRQGRVDQVTIPGQDTGQGAAEVREQKEPLPGTPGEALVPYHEVYYDYLNAAHQAVEQSYIPSGLKDYVREYFSQLEP